MHVTMNSLRAVSVCGGGREGRSGKGHRRINDDGGKSRHISQKCTLECFLNKKNRL